MTHPTTLIVLVNDADELGEMGKKKKKKQYTRSRPNPSEVRMLCFPDFKT